MPMPRALWWSEGGGRFIICEMSLYLPRPGIGISGAAVSVLSNQQTSLAGHAPWLKVGEAVSSCVWLASPIFI